ncbi:MAG TPA: amidohydrolase family protein [Mycobacterium sp.]|jgi:2,3-dihydroxybenzoate decarboxylase|nr:amidohydrolase family protein [Mycobacterium sp.]
MGIRKVTLEEHFNTPYFGAAEDATLSAFASAGASYIRQRIADFTEFRLPDMDAAGIDVQILSLTSPGVQRIADTAEAVTAARDVNDFLASVVRAHPDRFAGMATLATQEPAEAVAELERAVVELGMRGVLINGHANGVYLDDRRYWPLWDKVAELDVPVYLHPADPMVPWSTTEGHPELIGATWGWAFETGTHVLRLVMAGLFDAFPSLKIIVGHMGEMLPYGLWRLDDRYELLGSPCALTHPPSYYVKRNVYVTTAGVNSYEPFQCVHSVMGIDHILFSVDYPYQYADQAVAFTDSLPIGDFERELLYHGNAERLFGV